MCATYGVRRRRQSDDSHTGPQVCTGRQGSEQPQMPKRGKLQGRAGRAGKSNKHHSSGNSEQASTSNGRMEALQVAYVQFDKTFNMFSELLASPSGQPLDHGLGEVPGGFAFLDLGAAPGGFSSRLLEHSACAWGMGVTLPPDVGFPMLLGCGMGAYGNYYTQFADLFQVQACDLAATLGGERVDLCLCDAQNMRERHGATQKKQQGFVGLFGGSYGDHISPKVESLVIWALLFHQLGLAFTLLEEYGAIIFRFSWVLSIYDTEIQDCDRGYYDATMQLLHLLAAIFGTVDVFKSSWYHMSDSTCYIICNDFRRGNLEALVAEFGGVQTVFQRATQQALGFESMDKLPEALCLNLLPRPSDTRVEAVRSLLEKVTALREVGRMRKGLSSGQRFAHVTEAAPCIGKPLCQHDDVLEEPVQTAAAGSAESKAAPCIGKPQHDDVLEEPVQTAAAGVHSGQLDAHVEEEAEACRDVPPCTDRGSLHLEVEHADEDSAAIADRGSLHMEVEHADKGALAHSSGISSKPDSEQQQPLENLTELKVQAPQLSSPPGTENQDRSAVHQHGCKGLFGTLSWINSSSLTLANSILTFLPLVLVLIGVLYKMSSERRA